MMKTHLSPTVELAIMQCNLLSFRFFKWSVLLPRKPSGFPGLQWRSDQVCFLHEWTREILKPPIRHL
jgi:hypothetical protein